MWLIKRHYGTFYTISSFNYCYFQNKEYIQEYVFAFAENVREPRQLMQPLALPRSSNTDINEIQKRIKDIINRFKNGIWLSKIPHLYREAYGEDFNTALLSQFEYWPHVCTVGANFITEDKIICRLNF